MREEGISLPKMGIKEVAILLLVLTVVLVSYWGYAGQASGSHIYYVNSTQGYILTQELIEKLNNYAQKSQKLEDELIKSLDASNLLNDRLEHYVFTTQQLQEKYFELTGKNEEFTKKLLENSATNEALTSAVEVLSEKIRDSANCTQETAAQATAAQATGTDALSPKDNNKPVIQRRGAEHAGLTKSEAQHPAFKYSDPEVCIIVRTYPEQRDVLPALIASLASNNYPHLQVFLVDTIGDFSDLPKFASLFNSLYNKDFVHTPDVTGAKEKFPLFDEDGYGYLDLVLESLSSPNSEFRCDYFLATSGDNLYSKGFLKATVPHLRKSTDLVAVEFVTHGHESQSRPGCSNQKDFMLGQFDIGATLFRKQKAIDTKASFLKNHGGAGKSCLGELYHCDRYFFEDFVTAGATFQVVDGVYFVLQ